MGEDASLDDFLGDETAESEAKPEGTTADEKLPEEGDDEQADTADHTDSEPTDDGEPDERVKPATTTYAWDGAGAACGKCGEVTERRWEQDGKLVCTACKEW